MQKDIRMEGNLVPMSMDSLTARIIYAHYTGPLSLTTSFLTKPIIQNWLGLFLADKVPCLVKGIRIATNHC